MKKQDISSLKIDHVIVHDIPKHSKNDASISPDYSYETIYLENELREFFKRKIVESLSGIESFKVCYNNNGSSSMPSITKNLLDADKEGFINYSRDAGKELFDSQTGNNPSGILVIISGYVNDNKTIVILKLERDEGARLQKNAEKRTFIIQSVKDLMLTKKTKLYKAAIFLNRDGSGIDFDGYVTDSQKSRYYNLGIANFFLETFLGCTLYLDSRKQTQEMFNLTSEYISKIENPEKKTRISPEQFAIQCLEVEDQSKYNTFLTQNDADVRTAIIKDNELINNKLKRIKMEFDNGLSLYAENGDVFDKVSIEELPDRIIKAEIKARLKNVSS